MSTPHFEEVSVSPGVEGQFYNDGSGNIYTRTSQGVVQIKGGTTGLTTFGTVAHAGLLHGAGTSLSVPATTSTADSKFMSYYLENTATSGDNRGLYLRLYFSGAGAGGEAARIFTSVNDVAAGTCHGAHISLNFQSSGSVTGLGVAGRNTLHVPNVASWTPGTIAAVQAEIYSDGTNSDAGGATELSYIRCISDGHADGIADVDDDVYLLSLQGHTIGAGNLVVADTDETKFSHKIRIRIGSTDYYLMATAT